MRAGAICPTLTAAPGRAPSLAPALGCPSPLGPPCLLPAGQRACRASLEHTSHPLPDCWPPARLLRLHFLPLFSHSHGTILGAGKEARSLPSQTLHFTRGDNKQVNIYCSAAMLVLERWEESSG